MNSLDSQPGCPLPCCPRSAAQVGSRAHTKPLRVRQASRSVRLLHALSPVPPVTSPSYHQSLLSPVRHRQRRRCVSSLLAALPSWQGCKERTGKLFHDAALPHIAWSRAATSGSAISAPAL